MSLFHKIGGYLRYVAVIRGVAVIIGMWPLLWVCGDNIGMLRLCRYVEVYVPTAPLELLGATKPNCNV
jgi:hypothetical protein